MSITPPPRSSTHALPSCIPVVQRQVSVGNEAFLLWSYLVASASLSYRLKPVLLTVECALEKGISALFFSSGNFWQSSRCQIHSDVSAAAGEEGFVDEVSKMTSFKK